MTDRGELRRSASQDGECGKDQRPLDYVLLTWNESCWMGRLKDHLESMGDYGSEHAEGPGGKRCAIQPLEDVDICQQRQC